MKDTEQVFSARQASERLGLSPAMTRRYGAALEDVTGEAVRQHERDGRQYRYDQLDVMIRAKAFVESNPRLSVADALRLALGEGPEVAQPDTIANPETGPQTLENAFAHALERSLLPELRDLRAEVAALRGELREDRAAFPGEEKEPGTLPMTKTPRDVPGPETGDGPLVRLARQLERTFQRFRG